MQQELLFYAEIIPFNKKPQKTPKDEFYGYKLFNIYVISKLLFLLQYKYPCIQTAFVQGLCRLTKMHE